MRKIELLYEKLYTLIHTLIFKKNSKILHKILQKKFTLFLFILGPLQLVKFRRLKMGDPVYKCDRRALMKKIVKKSSYCMTNYCGGPLNIEK